MSSAYKRMSLVTFFVSPFKYIRARSGPSTDPCGQPESMVFVKEKSLPIRTFCRLSERYDFNQESRAPDMKNSFLHLKRSPLCQILSKYFEMSR